MIKVVDKIKIGQSLALSLQGDIENLEIGQVISDQDIRYRIVSVGMPNYQNPKDIRTKCEVLVEKV